MKLLEEYANLIPLSFAFVLASMVELVDEFEMTTNQPIFQNLKQVSAACIAINKNEVDRMLTRTSTPELIPVEHHQ